MTKPRQTITHLPLERLTAHPANVRDDLGDLTDLAKSIREHGILQPLTATEHPQHADRLILLAGHRRLGAALLAGETKVPVIIRHGLADESEHLVVMLVENTQRRDLSPVERAQAYGALRNRGLTQSEIARRTGTHVSTVNYYLSLLDLDDESLEAVRVGELKSTDAVAAVREARQQMRRANEAPLRGRPPGTVNAKPHFSSAHPLAPQVKQVCQHYERKLVGQIGCGPCWETVIWQQDRPPAAPDDGDTSSEVDQVLVERVAAGDLEGIDFQALNNAERHYVTDAWLDAGHSWSELERISGWKHGRYGRTRKATAADQRPHLTEDDVRNIRAAHSRGSSINALAANYGVTKNAVANIIHGRTWTHVTDHEGGLAQTGDPAA